MTIAVGIQDWFQGQEAIVGQVQGCHHLRLQASVKVPHNVANIRYI